MTIQNPCYVLQSASHGAELFRRADQSMIAGTGILGAGDLQVTQNGTPNMSVNVAAGQIWIPGTLGGTTAINLTNLNNQSTYGLPTGFTSQGSYYALNDATVNLAIAAASPTNPRIDIVCASVQDAFYSGSTNTPVLQVITGTPAPSPSPPAAPANSVVLAQVAVATSATQITNANITDKRPLLALAAPERGNPSGHCTQTAQFSVPSTSWVLVGNMASDFTTGGVSFASNVFTVPVAGKYLVAGQIQWNNNNSELYSCALWHNGAQATNSIGQTFGNPATNGALFCAFVDLVTLAAGDTVGMAATVGSGPINTGSTVSQTHFQVALQAA